MKNALVGVTILALLLAWSTSKMNDELIKYIDTKVDLEINKLRKEQLKHFSQEMKRWHEWSERMITKQQELTNWLLEKQKKLERERDATKT